MTFFSRLYRYKQSEFRNASEDYLTELLAEWLRLATSAGLLAEVLKGIFDYDPGTLGDAATLATVRWDTQHIIGPGYRDATGKRPDLVGQGKDFFLIIENKVSAGFTSYESAETGEEQNQLQLYQAYRNSRPEKHGGVAFLTFTTDPPPGWTGPVSYWSRVFNVIRRCCKQRDEQTALHYLGTKITQYMEDIGMAGTHFELSDIVVLPAYDRLSQGMTQLGSIAKRELSQGLATLMAASDQFPLREAHLGQLVPPEFFGSALTVGGHKANESSLIVWAGVLARSCYDLSPSSDGLPELIVGVGVWGHGVGFAGPDEQHMARLEQLIPTQSDGKWKWQVKNQAYSGVPLFTFSSRLTFIDMYGLTQGSDWDEAAGTFFKSRIRELLDALSSSTAPEGEKFVEYLYRLVS
ncbi:hypothetical protein [Pseudomonas sp. NPDC090208]|uniref:hypothetical protein n=1 Tax=Pseudomonas sp. NPDC090208 TaxID=3364478 RepID=UPI0038290C22